jgi:hypothetical protein
MQGQVKVLYGNSDVFSGICPTPFVYFDKEYIETSSNWGSIYNIKFEGQITGRLGPQSFYDLESKKNKLISSFKNDNLPVEIKEDSVQIFKSDICQIESLSFDESKYYGILPFTISASCYDKASFGENYGVTQPEDSWEYTENEDGTLLLRHSVSAAGFNSSGSSQMDSAISNAKKWAISKTGINKKIDSLKFGSVAASDFLLDSFSEQVDRFNGKYSLEEVFKADLLKTNSAGAGILRYTVEVSKDFERGITDVNIQGSVIGKKNIGLADLSVLRAKMNAEDFFQVAADSAEKSTGTKKINNLPYTRSVTESQNKSEISFSISYDDDPVPPGQAKCVYRVEMSENLIKNIVETKIDAEILCEKGDAAIRWDAVKSYYETKFNGYDLALKEYKRAGYLKSFSKTPRSESVNFDEFNSKITYSASWSDRYMPYPDILTFISEKVTVTPSLQVYTTQPSLYVNGAHNVQDFGCASRASVSISIEAICRPDKSMAQLKTCVLAELGRLRGIYVGSASLFVDEKSETVDEKMRKMSVSYSYSFEGKIVT